METEKEKLGVLPFVVGGLSFIPGIGIFFGIAVIVWGLVTKKLGGKKLAVVGACGIAFSVALYSALFYFAFEKRGGVYDDLRAKMAVSMLDALVPVIELYKTEHGAYPESLDELLKSLPQNSLVMIYDPTDVSLSKSGRRFYYAKADGGHYYLLALGPDGKPFTADDIRPSIAVQPDSHLGLLKKAGP